MELFQVFWDDQKNLFLELKTWEDEKFEIVPEKAKELNKQKNFQKLLISR